MRTKDGFQPTRRGLAGMATAVSLAGMPALAQSAQTSRRNQTPVFDGDASGKTDVTQALANFVASGGGMLQPGGQYLVSGTVHLMDGCYLDGGASSDNAGARLHFCRNDGVHLFDSDASTYLSGAMIRGFEVLNTINTPGSRGMGDCFHLNRVTNGCRFTNLIIRNFPGDAFDITMLGGGLNDHTAAGNVVFDEVFISSCGGYGFDIDGYVNAVWNMTDLNSIASGGFRFKNGVNNQASINIVGLWWEGTRPWAAQTVFDMINPNGQVLNLFGGTLVNGGDGVSQVVRSQGDGNGCVVNVFGLSGFGWTYFHNNVSAGETEPFQTSMTQIEASRAGYIQIRGRNAALDYFSTGSQNGSDRFIRTTFDNEKLRFEARNYSEKLVRNILSLDRAGDVYVDNGRVITAKGIGVGNSAAASVSGRIVRKIQVFDEIGNPIGFLPVYDTIA